MKKLKNFIIVFFLLASFANARPGTCIRSSGEKLCGNSGISSGNLPCYCDSTCSINKDCCDDKKSVYG